MKNIQKKKIAAGILISILLVAYVVRVYMVNANAFKVDREVYNMGETCRYMDFTYSVRSCQVMTEQQIEEKFGVKPVKIYSFDVDYVVAQLQISYVGEEEKAREPNSGYFKFTSGAWSNGGDTSLIHSVNSQGSIFEKGETKTIWAFGNLNEKMFTPWEWKKRGSMQFEIVLDTLPKEVVLKCY